MKKMNWCRFVAKVMVASMFAISLIGCPSKPKNKDEKKTDNNTPNKKNEIIIAKVKLGNAEVANKGTIEVDGVQADLKIEFAEAYEELAVKVGTVNATLGADKKSATYKVKGITESGIEVKIEATATGKDKKEYKFTAKKKAGGNVPQVAQVTSISFEGKEINHVQGATDRNKKEYSTTGSLLLSSIAEDGSHRVGTIKLPTLKVSVGHATGAVTPTFNLKNKTTDVNVNGVAGTNSLSASIELQRGDNNIEITYSEKDKNAVTYKVVVEWDGTEYMPITRIDIADNSYTTKKAFADLEKGNITFKVEGEAETIVKVKMEELWYIEDGWTLKIAGDNIAKESGFTKGSGSSVLYTATKTVALTSGGAKDIEIEFANNARSYTKKYKVSVTHVAINKIDFVRIIDADASKEVDNEAHINFAFDDTNNYYKTKDKVLLGKVEKATFLISPKDTTITPKYIFDSNVALPQESAGWQTATKESITYTDKNNTSQTIETFVVKNRDVETGTQYLFVLLEKGSLKTYYCVELKKDGVPKNNTEQVGFELVYQNNNGETLEDHSKLATKGLIRVKPKSPKAKVNLLTPVAQKKAFTKKEEGWHECVITLDADEVVFTYEIVAEDTTTKLTYNQSNQKFTRYTITKEFKFDYVANGLPASRNIVDELDGKYFVALYTDEVKADKKLYFFLETYKGVTLEGANEFGNIQTEDLPPSSSMHKFSVDISSLITTPSQTKTCQATLKLENAVVGNIELNIFVASPIIKMSGFAVHRITPKQVAANKFICKADLNDTINKKLSIELHIPEGKDGTTSKQLVKVFKPSDNEIAMQKKATMYELKFVNDNFTIDANEKITLTIKYWEDEANASGNPIHEYELEIQDI